MSKELNNIEILTIVVFLLGGRTKPVDSEDIAYKANEIAPGRFSWRKYKDQISIDSVRKRLCDARLKKYDSMLVGSERLGWSLTETGLNYATKHAKSVTANKSLKEYVKPEEKKRLNLERERMISSAAYQKYILSRKDEITISEARVFFRIDEYLPNNLLESKIVRIVNSFSNDPELGNLVGELAERVRKIK